MSADADLFVGRGREVEELRGALAAACAGKGRMVMLAGEPGIGKTRTALELTAHAKSLDAQMLWGRCHEEAGAPPHWPWMQILRALAASKDERELRDDLGAGAGDIAEIVPEVRARLPDLDAPPALSDPSGNRFRLFGSIARFLVNASRRRPLTLVLDDLHWADIPSLRLLEFIAQEMSESRLLIVGAYRETELSRSHRLSDTLGALTRTPHILRLRLAGLGVDDVRRFVTASAGAEPPAWLTNAIFEHTEGNPLFVREIVRLLVQDGLIDGSAAARRSIRLPEGVKEVIGRRLNLLPAACNAVLATASAIGREFSLDVLTRASPGLSEDAILTALDEAVAAHIVEEPTPGTYQFTHNLVRITLYDELRTGERRRLHHAVGEAIEATHRRNLEPVLADLAHHFRSSGMAGDAERAIDYGIRAGRSADAALAFEDGISLFQNALDTLDTLGMDDPDRRCRLLFLLGDVQRKANSYVDALETLRRASEIARARGLWEVQAEAALSCADIAWRTTTHLNSRSGQMLEEALACVPEPEFALRIKLTSFLARDRLHSGDPDDARRVGAQAIAMARRSGDVSALATALSAQVDVPWRPEETQQMLVEARELTELGERANEVEIALRGHFRQTSMLLELGDMDAAAAAIAAIGRFNARLRQPFFTPWDIAVNATLAMTRGDLGLAERLILEILRGQQRYKFQTVDPPAMLVFSLRREQCRLKELGPLAQAFVRRSSSAAIWRPGLAALYVELGDLAAARTVLLDLARNDFEALPHDGRLSASLMYLSEVCAALSEADIAPALYRLMFPWSGRNVVMGGGTGYWGSADRFLGLLCAAEGRGGEAERHFAEALAMSEKTGSFAPWAHVQVDLAELRMRLGDPAKAALHLQAAEARGEALGLPLVLARAAEARKRLSVGAEAPANPDNLTSRERDVLRLLAIGRGNADIALALDIGHSTVATHVHNILTKTGCANRTEAAAYAARRRLPAD